MNIFECADLINKNIEITRHANQNGRYTAQFEHCEIERGISLGDVYVEEEGVTITEAINDYARKISGKVLVFNAESTDRIMEYEMPKITGAKAK